MGRHERYCQTCASFKDDWDYELHMCADCSSEYKAYYWKQEEKEAVEHDEGIACFWKTERPYLKKVWQKRS